MKVLAFVLIAIALVGGFFILRRRGIGGIGDQASVGPHFDILGGFSAWANQNPWQPAPIDPKAPNGRPYGQGGLADKCNQGFEQLRSSDAGQLAAQAGSKKTGVPPEQLRQANQISQKVFCTQVLVAEKIANAVYTPAKAAYKKIASIF